MKKHYEYVMPGKTMMHCRFKGGGSSKTPSSTLSDTEAMKKIRGQFYPVLENAMNGRGFGETGTPQLFTKDLMAGYNRAFTDAKADYMSQMNRVVDPEDTRVKGFIGAQLNREQASGRDALQRQIKAERIGDKDMGLAMAGDAVAMEQRMSVNGAQMYNQALQANMINERQFGTFGTNLAGGIGSGLMDLYFAKQISGGATV